MISRLLCLPVSRSRLVVVSLLTFCFTFVSRAFGETPDSIVLPAAINLAIKNSATLNAAKRGWRGREQGQARQRALGSPIFPEQRRIRTSTRLKK